MLLVSRNAPHQLSVLAALTALLPSLSFYQRNIFVMAGSYPRPLKATQAFQPTPPSLSSRTSPGSPSSRSFGRVPQLDYLSTEAGAAVAQSVGGECSARRSSSLNSLTDVGAVMWTRSSPQLESHRDTTATHRRTNSVDKTIQSQEARDIHWRHSAEGLNQEVSSVLEGKMLFCDEQHPDGHRAPVNELLNGRKLSFHSTSPCQPGEQDSSLLHRDSPRIVEHHTYYSNIPSPNFSFAREPPDSAERCTIIQEPGVISGEVIPRCPDKTKANIVFKGSAFAPLLPTHSLKSMVIT